jgi:pentatricopeptide repeat protein
MKIPKKRLIVIACVVGAVVLVGGGWLGFMVWQSAQKVAEQEQVSKQPKPAVQYDNRQELINDVNQKYGTKDFEGAIRVIEAQRSLGEDPALQLLLAGAYANSGDVKKALEIYKKLDSAGTLPQTEWGNMAEMAERAGEDSVALTAYKRAKEYAVSSKSESSDQIAVYEYKIAELEKKQ